MKLRNAIFFAAFALTILTSRSTLAGLSAKKIGDSDVDSKALILGEKQFGNVRFGNRINGGSFQQEAVVTHEGHQYVGYYNGDRQVCIARRKLPLGKWEIIRFGDYSFRNNDAHNTISIGICPVDGTIHVAFDHHCTPLHYRVSTKGAATHPATTRWQASLFGPILSEL